MNGASARTYKAALRSTAPIRSSLTSAEPSTVASAQRAKSTRTEPGAVFAVPRGPDLAVMSGNGSLRSSA